jgi:hypothetical protein
VNNIYNDAIKLQKQFSSDLFLIMSKLSYVITAAQNDKSIVSLTMLYDSIERLCECKKTTFVFIYMCLANCIIEIYFYLSQVHII